MLRSPVISVSTVVALLLLGGCATDRAISPTISAEPRTGLLVSPPILGAVYDGRAKQEPKDAAATLQADLSRLYGSSIEWSDYFERLSLVEFRSDSES
jgi:hypothetical protein